MMNERSNAGLTLLRRPAGRRNGLRASQGFTLVELLVVICIIGILSALTLVGVISAINGARVSNTEQLIQQLVSCCENYRVRWGDYPVSTLAELKAKLPNDTNNGAEALCACLSSEDGGGRLYAPASDESYINIEGDRLEKNPNNWFFGDNDLREIADLWRRPITYLHSKDYAKGGGNVCRYLLSDGGEEQTLKSERSTATSTYAFPDKFQIRSAGKDGVLGTDDDVKGW